MRTLTNVVYHCRHFTSLSGTPEPGDLVIEITGHKQDDDSLGYLLGHGQATYREDNRGARREVWDVVPLSLDRGRNLLPYQRWENAQFVRCTVKPPLRFRWRARLRYLRTRRRFDYA